jgi:predicted nucleic acid-binding protein
MIVLDTNVISELTRKAPEPSVVDWLDALPADRFATTAVTVAELLYGVARLPAGRRKTELADAVGALITEVFRDRIEPYDCLAAEFYAKIVTNRERAGRPMSMADAQIAAICRVREAALATRNTADFVGTGIRLVNPWNADLLGRLQE